jgi:hypothetical protein
MQRKAEKAALPLTRQSRSMNYHNFASRLTIRRLPAANNTKDLAKPKPKKTRRPIRRPFAHATATLLSALSVLTMRVEAADQKDTRTIKPSGWNVNAPTLIVTLTGLGVALLRVSALWRRDFDC